MKEDPGNLWKNQQLEERLKDFSSKSNVTKKLKFFNNREYILKETATGFSKQVLPLQQYLSNNNNEGTYREDLKSDLIFKNPLSIELMADSFDLVDFQSFLETKEISPHDYYDYIKDEQNRNWAIQMIREGITLSKQGKDSKALDCYNQAIDVDPNNVDAFVAKGALQCKLENFNDSIKQFNIALGLDPDHPNAKKYLQIAKVKMEDYDEKKRREYDIMQNKVKNNNSKSKGSYNTLSTSIEIPSMSDDDDDVIINDEIQLTQKLRTIMKDIHGKKNNNEKEQQTNKDKSDKKEKRDKKDKHHHKSREKDKKYRNENERKSEKNERRESDKSGRRESDNYERRESDKKEKKDKKDSYKDNSYSSSDNHYERKRKRDDS
jgi:tetratricopeptide (TPR) repeat protein